MRKHTVSEKRFSKYLLYAIGEIILVVIGILIALQINNWNSDRIQTREENVYLHNIMRDLDLQLDAIESQLLYERKIIETSSKIISDYKTQNTFTVDSSFTARIGQISGRMTFSVHNSTYIELLTSGKLDILKDARFKNDFIKFNQNLERTESVINKNNDFVDKVFIADLINLTETQLNSIFEMESFKDVFDPENTYVGDMALDLNEDKLKEITRQQLSVPENELTLINEINYRNRIAMVAYQFLIRQKKNLNEIKPKLAEILTR